MEELISIIIPVYNVEKYIKKCIESVIDQTYKNLEIILIDDGSKDSSLNICNEYLKKDKRIKVIQKENGGASSARNLGLNNANGEYICFIDSDDYIENVFCENMIKALKENKVDCVGCGYYRVYENNIKKIVEPKSCKMNKEQFIKSILQVQTGTGFVAMKLWKKSTIENLRFRENMKVGEDAFFCTQASENIESFYMLNEALYYYRFNNNSLVRRFDEHYAETYLNSMIITKNYIEKAIKENVYYLEKLNNYISYHVLLIIINFCCNPQNKKNFWKQTQSIIGICNIEIFKEAIKKSDYEGLSITRKIALFTIKHKLYFITTIIGRVRQIQFRNS